MLFYFLFKRHITQTKTKNIEMAQQSNSTEMDQLKQTVAKQAEQIDRLTSELHELLGGLFHNIKQAGTLSHNVSMLFGTRDSGDFEDDPNSWESWPTTRQGFELERRVDELEDRLAQFGELFPKNRDVNRKLSECLDERKKRSASLCGNE